MSLSDVRFSAIVCFDEGRLMTVSNREAKMFKDALSKNHELTDVRTYVKVVKILSVDIS